MSFLKIKDENGNFIPVKALNGKTPVKGIDYFTEEDKQEFINYVSENIEISTDNLSTVPVEKGGTGATDADTARSNLNAQKNLGFTPVQQGGGTNQGGNKIYLGWSNDAKLNVQVDSTNLGNLITDSSAYGVILPVAKGGTGAKNAATARTNLGITPANIGAAPTEHTHDFIKNVSKDTALLVDLDASVTPVIFATKGGKNQWAIGGYTNDLNHLTLHYYNDGNWAGNNVILDAGNYSNYANAKVTQVCAGGQIAKNGTFNIGTTGYGAKVLFTTIDAAPARIYVNGTTGTLTGMKYYQADDFICIYAIGLNFTTAGVATVTQIRIVKIDSNGLGSINNTSFALGKVYALT